MLACDRLPLLEEFATWDFDCEQAFEVGRDTKSSMSSRLTGSIAASVGVSRPSIWITWNMETFQ